MTLFTYCTCGHTEEDHAIDAPEGEQECLAEGCGCEDFNELPDDLVEEFLGVEEADGE